MLARNFINLYNKKVNNFKTFVKNFRSLKNFKAFMKSNYKATSNNLNKAQNGLLKIFKQINKIFAKSFNNASINKNLNEAQNRAFSKADK